MADKVLGDMPSYATGELSAAELEKIRATAREKVQKEIHEKLFAAALEEAEREERIAAGLTPKTGSTVKDDPMMSVTLNLPMNVVPVGCLLIDGKAYYDGFSYDVPKTVAMQIASMQAEAWRNQEREEGKFTDFRKPKPQIIGAKATVVNPAIVRNMEHPRAAASAPPILELIP